MMVNQADGVEFRTGVGPYRVSGNRSRATKYRPLSPEHNGASGTSDMAGYAARVAVERAGASEIQLAILSDL